MDKQPKKKSKHTVTARANAYGVAPKKPITHLYLNDKHLTSIENKTLPETLCVLYLHSNAIKKIENLNSASNLQNLYLQKNKISKIQNLGELRKLKKLYLGHNKISVVEGLENLEHLEELHIEKQKLRNKESLCFDPRTVCTLSRSLLFLNISNNNLTSIEQLAPLKFIKSFNASNNHLQDNKAVSDVLCNWFHLTEATFIGNPIVKQHRYRENLIASTICLSLLDNKTISETTRNFMKRFEKEKIHHSSRQAINLVDKISSVAKNYPTSIQKSVSQSILRNSKPCFDNSTMHSDANDIYIPWNAMPKSASNIKDKSSRGLKNQPKRGPYIGVPIMFPHFS